MGDNYTGWKEGSRPERRKPKPSRLVYNHSCMVVDQSLALVFRGKTDTDKDNRGPVLLTAYP